MTKNPFKFGDRVMCLDNREAGLTAAHVYRVIGITETLLFVRCDDSVNRYFKADIFILCEPSESQPPTFQTA